MSRTRILLSLRGGLSLACVASTLVAVLPSAATLADGEGSPTKLRRVKPHRQPDLVSLASFQDPAPAAIPLPPQSARPQGPSLGEPAAVPTTSEPAIAIPEGQLDQDDSLPKNTPPRSTEPLRVKPLQIPDISIDGIGTGVTPEDATAGRLPPRMPLPFGPDRGSDWTLSTYNWIAPVYCHNPNYYEDVMLEHHGHERCPPLQPILSGARFYSGLFFTPYLAYLHPPCQDFTNAGHYRVGSPAPALRQRAPYSPGAIKLQLLMTSTGVLILAP